MGSQSRILLILAVFALGGVAALTAMAHRYGKVLEGRAEARPVASEPDWTAVSRRPDTSRLAGDVDRFIEIRRQVREAIEARPDVPRTMLVRTTREAAIRRAGLAAVDYVRIRQYYRLWRDGRLRRTEPLAAIFDRRSAELTQVDLGEDEALDS